MSAQPYDPDQAIERGRLAAAIRSALDAAGFEVDRSRSRGETVYRRRLSHSDGKGGRVEVPHTDVLIYTTIYGDEVKYLGRDAIRVVVVYREPEKPARGLVKEARVFRTGTIPRIVERTVERARAAWGTALAIPRCRQCGAPTFVSKKKNRVCAAVCFAKGASEASPR